MISEAYSDIGKKRLANEDSYFVSEFTKISGILLLPTVWAVTEAVRLQAK